MKRRPRVLLLVDWIPAEGFSLVQSLRKSGIECDVMGTDRHLPKWTPATKVVSHWPSCFRVSLKAYRLRREYDYVIAWQQIMGMFLGLLKLFTFSNSPPILLLTAIVVERQNPWMQWLRKVFITVAWKKVDHIGFLSHAYKRFIQNQFGVSEGQAVVLPLPIIIDDIPEYSGFKAGSYLYSVGRSCRDYKTLMVAARKSSHRFVVVTSEVAIGGLTIPDNVTVLRDIFGRQANRLMQEAAAVIIPLDRTQSPAGELTLLETMCYGKPLIITRTVITEEYITDGQDGFLVPARDPDAIVAAVESILSDSEKAAAMGRMARKTVLKNHALDAFTRRVAGIIRDAVGLSAEARAPDAGSMPGERKRRNPADE